MNRVIAAAIRCCVLAGSGIAVLPINAQVNVTQHHNHASRDGLYVDPAFTQSASANLVRDTNFVGTISGHVFAQPLYVDNGPGGRPTIIAVTDSNDIYALDAVDGSIIWQCNVGAPVAVDPCGNSNPAGIIGTPIIDLNSRALFLNAMTTPDGGNTVKHLIFSLNIDTGGTNAGWPVDVGAVAIYNGTTFTPSIQYQRSALGIVGGILYVPYGSFQDCGVYHGWLVGVPIDNPANITAWAAATKNHGGAIWGVGGIASDGKNPFVTTGNTFSPSNWEGGEAVIRFQPGPIFSGSPSDYWAPLDWLDLDILDFDLGGCGPLLVDVPGATPSRLVVALGKNTVGYLLNRDNLGGISLPVAQSSVDPGNSIIQAAVTYRTEQGTYVAFRATKEKLSTFRITATNPPTILSGWSATRTNGGCGSPFVTTTDGSSNPIVWVMGTAGWGIEGDQRLHGYDGETGAVVYAGGGPNELIPGTHTYSTTGIVARGHIYIAGDNKVYAFRPSRPNPTPRSRPTPHPRPTPHTRPIRSLSGRD
jgi:outer membrane protein assembly factor BamB